MACVLIFRFVGKPYAAIYASALTLPSASQQRAGGRSIALARSLSATTDSLVIASSVAASIVRGEKNESRACEAFVEKRHPHLVRFH